MPRPLRIQEPGATYHVIVRAVEGAALFRDSDDSRLFVRLLGRTITKHGWRLHAYCLMTTHSHAVIETPAPNLARGMQNLNGRYAQMFNERHGRSGHLVHSRYTAVVIESEEQYAAAVRYIWLNPVRAGLCERAEEWPWSDARAFD